MNTRERERDTLLEILLVSKAFPILTKKTVESMDIVQVVRG